MSDSEKKKCGRDFVRLGPELSDGTRVVVRHKPDCTMQVGLGKIVGEGESLLGCDRVLFGKGARDGAIDIEAEHEFGSGESSGPAKVTTEAYRAGWDRIFGKVHVGSA